MTQDPTLRVKDLIEGAVEHYDNTAPEYARWITQYMGDVDHQVRDYVTRHVAGVPTALELACGSGYLTEMLSSVAGGVTAVDASRRMLDIVAALALPNVDLIQGDLFKWMPTGRWAVVAMSHWLSHVPPAQVPPMFDQIRDRLAPTGSVLVVDVTSREAFIEQRRAVIDGEAVVLRPTRDSNGARSTRPILKKYWEPNVLLSLLNVHGWSGTYAVIGNDRGRGFVIYEFWRSST